MRNNISYEPLGDDLEVGFELLADDLRLWDKLEHFRWEGQAFDKGQRETTQYEFREG